MHRLISARRAFVAGLALSILLSGTARADASDSEGVGYGIGAALCSVVYGPAKIVYALLGSVIGGGAWAVTGGATTGAPPNCASAGYADYDVPPDVLRGERPLEFVGRSPDSAGREKVASPPSDGF